MKHIRICYLLMTVGFLAGSGVAFAQDSDAACAKLDKDTLTVDLPCYVSGGKTYSAMLKGEIVNGLAGKWHTDRSSIVQADFVPDNKACAVLSATTNDLKLNCVLSHGKVWQAQLSAKYPGSEQLIWGLESYGPATPSVAFGGEEQNWLSMSDQKFAEKFAEMAFSYSLVKREIVAWLLFTRAKASNYIVLEAPALFTPNIPVDVDPLLQEALINEGDIYQLNELYNIYSWQALIAINWPLDANGNVRENFTDKGIPAWLKWKEAFQVFRADGKKPAPWKSTRTGSGLGLKESVLDDSGSRIILNSITPTHTGNLNIADETDQAFSGQLFDQNGNVVVYEVLINKEEFDYIVDNNLYNINGQLKFSKTNTEANFPAGNYESQELGATEIKLAWKILEDTDHKERYFKDEGYIINEKTGETKKENIGLIGFHISQKTPSGKQWVWSTFEHIDNLDQNVIELDNEKTVIPPTLTNPDCEICPVNVDVNNGKNTYEYYEGEHSDYWKVTKDPAYYYTDTNKIKTQAKRMVDIPVRVERINTKMQAYFKEQGSVWQYYQLIDTQYPVYQNEKPATSTIDDYHIPESVINKPGGKPNLALLTNITMETFFQGGNQVAGLMENSTSKDPEITIFGTESCIGCHSSAYLYNSYTFQEGVMTLGQGTQLSGDFSWLLKKATWEEGLAKPTSEN